MHLVLLGYVQKMTTRRTMMMMIIIIYRGSTFSISCWLCWSSLQLTTVQPLRRSLW